MSDTPLTSTFKQIRRQSHKGANLIILALFIVLFLGFLGVAIYLGLQAYGQNELQKAATTATLAGASVMYSFDAGGNPRADEGVAQAEANNVVVNILGVSEVLQLMNPVPMGISTNTGDQSVSMGVTGTLPTPFLSLVGINQIELEAQARSRALKYTTQDYGPIVIDPTGGSPGSFAKVVELDFPLISNDSRPTNYEAIVRQSGYLRGYSVEACNSAACYMLTTPNSASWISSSRAETHPIDGVVYGTVAFDLNPAGVNKASKLRVADDGIYDSFNGGTHYLDSSPTVIDSIEILGPAASCPIDSCANVEPKGLKAIQ